MHTSPAGRQQGRFALELGLWKFALQGVDQFRLRFSRGSGHVQGLEVQARLREFADLITKHPRTRWRFPSDNRSPSLNPTPSEPRLVYIRTGLDQDIRDLSWFSRYSTNNCNEYSLPTENPIPMLTQSIAALHAETREAAIVDAHRVRVDKGMPKSPPKSRPNSLASPHKSCGIDEDCVRRPGGFK